MAARRVAAAGAALGAQAAASGSSITMPVAEPLSPAAAAALGLDPKPQAVHSRLPETDAAMAAASAAAAAAVAAVSAAIAATAAANASKTVPAEAIAAATAATPIADPTVTGPVPVDVAADVAPSLETPVVPDVPAADVAAAAVAVPPTKPQFDPRNAPVTVTGYVRPPGRDVPGLTRANRDWEQQAEPLADAAAAEAATADSPVAVTAAAATSDSSSDVPKGRWARGSATQGVAAVSTESRTAYYRRKLATVAAAVAAALLVAGVAFGHRALPVARSAAAVLAHVLTVPVRVGNRLFARPDTPPVYDEYGTEQRRRKIAPGWLLFVGFYGLIFAAIGANMLLGPASAEGAHPSMSGGIAAADATRSPGLTAAPSPTASPIGTVTTDPPTLAPSPSVEPTPVPTDTPVATATPTPTTPPTAAATKKATPKPTARRTTAPPPPAGTPVPPAPTPAPPTPVPTPAPPTPAPTPTPTPAMFATISFTGIETISGKDYAVFMVTSLPGATCYDMQTVSGVTRWTSKTFTTDPATGKFAPAHATSNWQPGTYYMKTSCTAIDGRSRQSTAVQFVIP